MQVALHDMRNMKQALHIFEHHAEEVFQVHPHLVLRALGAGCKSVLMCPAGACLLGQQPHVCLLERHFLASRSPAAAGSFSSAR